MSLLLYPTPISYSIRSVFISHFAHGYYVTIIFTSCYEFHISYIHKKRSLPRPATPFIFFFRIISRPDRHSYSSFIHHTTHRSSHTKKNYIKRSPYTNNDFLPFYPGHKVFSFRFLKLQVT